VIVLKSPAEVEKLRRANVIVAEVLKVLEEYVKPGIATIELESRCEEELRRKKARPAFKSYKDYPFCLCTSINEEVVHGMPSKRKLGEGDILSIDLGVYLNGFYGDAAVTLPVGEITEEAKRLVRVTSTALDRAVEAAREGNRLMDISAAIQQCAESEGFSVVRDFVGHGIGRELHEAPQVPNFGIPGRGVRLKEGMVLAIEPMINAGASAVRVLDDGWTAVTADGKLSAHFEHSVAITKKGPLVLSNL
jgi:methionyl aminopeptidase